MENLNHYSSEDLQKCLFHSQQYSQGNNNEPSNDANTGDWDDERDDAGTDPHRYDPEKFKEGSNDNSGGAGSTGSGATNS
jgi:hypothetical protein